MDNLDLENGPGVGTPGVEKSTQGKCLVRRLSTKIVTGIRLAPRSVMMYTLKLSCLFSWPLLGSQESKTPSDCEMEDDETLQTIQSEYHDRPTSQRNC